MGGETWGREDIRRERREEKEEVSEGENVLVGGVRSKGRGEGW